MRQDKFVAVDCSKLPWLQAVLPSGEAKGVSYQWPMQGGDGEPQVVIARYEPNWTEARHRHPEDEVLAILEGDITVDGVTHRAPTVVFVSRGTLYGPLTAGPDGVLLLRVAYTEEMIRQPDATRDQAPV